MGQLNLTNYLGHVRDGFLPVVCGGVKPCSGLNQNRVVSVTVRRGIRSVAEVALLLTADWFLQNLSADTGFSLY